MEEFTPLTTKERKDFSRLHRRAKKSQMQQYHDLREIHDRRLYRGTGTWDEYLAEHWEGATRQQAARWFDHVWAWDLLSPVGDIQPSQRHARELARLRRGLEDEANADGQDESLDEEAASSAIDDEVRSFAAALFDCARAEDRQLSGDEIGRAVDDRLKVDRPHRETGYHPPSRAARAAAVVAVANELCEALEPLDLETYKVPRALGDRLIEELHGHAKVAAVVRPAAAA